MIEVVHVCETCRDLRQFIEDLQGDKDRLREHVDTLKGIIKELEGEIAVGKSTIQSLMPGDSGHIER